MAKCHAAVGPELNRGCLSSEMALRADASTTETHTRKTTSHHICNLRRNRHGLKGVYDSDGFEFQTSRRIQRPRSSDDLKLMHLCFEARLPLADETWKFLADESCFHHISFQRQNSVDSKVGGLTSGTPCRGIWAILCHEGGTP